MTVLKNQEKAVIVDALRDKYSLPLLLRSLKLSRSSYYYQHKIAHQVNTKHYAAESRCCLLRSLGDTAIAGFMHYWPEKALTSLRKSYVE